MIKLKKLESFKFYRTSNNIHISSGAKNEKKGMIVSVLAPSINEEIKYLDKMFSLFNLRYFERYLIEKWTYFKPHSGAVKKINNSDEDDNKNPSISEIKKLFSEGKTSNTTQVSDFYLYDPNVKTISTLKDFNFIYEINHILKLFMTDPKDKRIVADKRTDFYDILIEYLVSKISDTAFSKHTDKVLFIPVNLWINFEDYKSAETLKAMTFNPISMIYNVLKSNPDKINMLKGWKIILNSYNDFMILNIDDYIKDQNSKKPKYEPIHDYFYKFLYACKSESYQTEIQDSEETDTSKEEEASKVEELAVSIASKKGIDLDNADSSDIKKLEDLASDIIKGDGTLNQKDDEIDELTDLIKNKNQGISVENAKRNQMLAEKYKDIKLVTATGKSLNVIDISDEVPKIEPIKINAKLANKTLATISSANVYENYINGLYYKHLVDILHYFESCTPKMYMIGDIKEEDVSDHMNKLMKYTVTFEAEDRSRHNMSFLLPKFYQDRYLFINSSKKDITMQKFPYPITKTAENMTQLVGDYKKVFIERYGMNVSPRNARLVKFLNTYKSSKFKIIKGDTTGDNNNYLIPIEFGELSKHFYLIIEGDYKFIFKIDDAIMEIGYKDGEKDAERYIPFAKSKSNKYYVDNHTDMVIDRSGTLHGSISSFIFDCFISTEKESEEKIKALSVGSRYMYSRAVIMSYNIPAILLASSLHDRHFLGVLELAKIEYELSEKRPSVDKDVFGVVKFSDTYLIYNRSPYSNSLLMEGLNDVPTEEYTLAEMGERETYIDIFDEIYSKRNLIEALENFKQLFLGPITKQVQSRLNNPTDFISMLLMGSDLLSDNSYKIESSYEMSRIRGPEIVLIYLYQALADAYGKFRIDSKNNKFTIPQDAVIKLLMKTQLVDEHSTINYTLETENDRRIKSKGPTGLNVDQAYTLEKRAFHPSMKGIVSLSTAASGEVGITRQLTINSNIVDALGFVKTGKSDNELDGSQLLGSAELLNAFSVESADSTRSLMTTGQHKHLITTKVMSGPLISTDYEKVIPHLSKDFAYRAKRNGKVLAIENGIMFVKYDDGTVDDVDLNEIPYKHTNAGKYNVNRKITKLKEGDKFNEGDILAHDPKQFSVDLFGDIVANVGTLATVAVINTGGSYEDSNYIVNSLARKMTSTATVKKDIVISPSSNIKKYAKKGDLVEVGDYLLVFDDVDDEFAASILSTLNDSDDSVHFGSKPVKSKVKGVVKDIKVYFTVPFEDLTKSMQGFVKSVASYESDKGKTIKKFMDIKNATTIVSPIEQTIPDSLGRVKGVKVEEGVLIEYYVEYENVAGVGDKTTFSAVKGVIYNVIEDKYAAFPISDPDRPIELFTSLIGISKRMVLDIYKLLIGCEIMVSSKKEFINLFSNEISSKASK